MTPRTVEVPVTRLADLQQKEIAHDDYLAALRLSQRRLSLYRIRHGDLQGEARGFFRGYQEALTDLAQFIADVSIDRLTEAAMVDSAGAPVVLDRAVPGLRVPRG